MNSESLLNWTIQSIRDDEGLGSWLEERKYDWIPLVEGILKKIVLHESETIIIITDTQNEWFSEYIISNINRQSTRRPYLPFVTLKSFYPNIDAIVSQDDIALLIDMLDITFKQKYTFWYIGHNDNIRATIAKMHEDSFLWIYDEHIQNSFYLSSIDPILDMKLLQLFRLFNKSLSASLFCEITF